MRDLIGMVRCPAVGTDHDGRLRAHGFNIFPHATQYVAPAWFGAPQCEQYTGPGVLAVRSKAFQDRQDASTSAGTGSRSRGSHTGACVAATRSPRRAASSSRPP